MFLLLIEWKKGNRSSNPSKDFIKNPRLKKNIRLEANRARSSDRWTEQLDRISNRKEKFHTVPFAVEVSINAIVPRVRLV